MAWIESHQSLARHPKLLRTARALGVTRPTMVGHLHLLWWFALDYARDGDLSGFDDKEVADAAEFSGQAKHFRETLEAHGWIDIDGTLHDWADYTATYNASTERRAREKRQAAERQARRRARHATPDRDAPVTSRPRHAQTDRDAHRDAPVTHRDVTKSHAATNQPTNQPDQPERESPLPLFNQPTIATNAGEPRPPTAIRDRIAKLHAWYCDNTGRAVPMLAAERTWFEWTRHGWTDRDLETVVRYLDREIKRDKRNPGALRLDNLLAPDRFAEDLGQAMGRNGSIKPIHPRPAPTPPPPPAPKPPASTPEQRKEWAEQLKAKRLAIAGAFTDKPEPPNKPVPLDADGKPVLTNPAP